MWLASSVFVDPVWAPRPSSVSVEAVSCPWLSSSFFVLPLWALGPASLVSVGVRMGCVVFACAYPPVYCSGLGQRASIHHICVCHTLQPGAVKHAFAFTYHIFPTRSSCGVVGIRIAHQGQGSLVEGVLALVAGYTPSALRMLERPAECTPNPLWVHPASTPIPFPAKLTTDPPLY